MRVRTKRTASLPVFVMITFVFAYYLVHKTSILNFKLIEPTNLFTYFGALLGFSLTLYTFGLSMISDIIKNLMELYDFKEIEKKNMLNKIINGFMEIKGDIWIIFSSLILVIFLAAVNKIPNPFGWEVEKYMIPQSFNLTLLILTTYSMYDIIRSLFSLSEMKLELFKNN